MGGAQPPEISKYDNRSKHDISFTIQATCLQQGILINYLSSFHVT